MNLAVLTDWDEQGESIPPSPFLMFNRKCYCPLRGIATKSISNTKSLFAGMFDAGLEAPYACSAGITKRRVPPIFIPGTPYVQPLIT